MPSLHVKNKTGVMKRPGASRDGKKSAAENVVAKNYRGHNLTLLNVSIRVFFFTFKFRHRMDIRKKCHSSAWLARLPKGG